MKMLIIVLLYFVICLFLFKLIVYISTFVSLPFHLNE